MDNQYYQRIKIHLFSIAIALLIFIALLAMFSSRTLGLWEGTLWPVQKLTSIKVSEYTNGFHAIPTPPHVLVDTQVEKIRNNCDYLGLSAFIVNEIGQKTLVESDRLNRPAILTPGETVNSLQIVHIDWEKFQSGEFDILYEKYYTCHPFWITTTPQIITYNLTTVSK